MILLETMSQNSMLGDCCECLMFVPGYSPKNTPTLAECCLINTCFNFPCFVDYSFEHACTVRCGADHLSEACVQNSCICGYCLLYGKYIQEGLFNGDGTWYDVSQQGKWNMLSTNGSAIVNTYSMRYFVQRWRESRMQLPWRFFSWKWSRQAYVRLVFNWLKNFFYFFIRAFPVIYHVFFKKFRKPLTTFTPGVLDYAMA